MLSLERWEASEQERWKRWEGNVLEGGKVGMALSWMDGKGGTIVR